MATQKHDPDTRPSHASADANRSTDAAKGSQGTRTPTAPDASKPDADKPDADRAAKPGQHGKAGCPQDGKAHVGHDSNATRRPRSLAT